MENSSDALMEETYALMVEAQKKLESMNKMDEVRSRELSLTITKLEEAMLWFKQHGNRGRWTL